MTDKKIISGTEADFDGKSNNEDKIISESIQKNLIAQMGVSGDMVLPPSLEGGIKRGELCVLKAGFQPVGTASRLQMHSSRLSDSDDQSEIDEAMELDPTRSEMPLNPASKALQELRHMRGREEFGVLKAFINEALSKEDPVEHILATVPDGRRTVDMFRGAAKYMHKHKYTDQELWNCDNIVLSRPSQMIRKHIRGLVADAYADNDAAHRLDHADAVCDMAVRICYDTMNYEYLNECIVAAYAHDVMARDRDHHHELAADWTMYHGDLFKQTYKMPQAAIHRIAHACLEHRASWKGNYTSIVSEIIACADRGKPPVEINELYRRSYIYALSKLKYSDPYARTHAFEHIREKFGRDGYVKYPSLYKKMWGGLLNEMWDKIDQLKIEDLEESFQDWAATYWQTC